MINTWASGDPGGDLWCRPGGTTPSLTVRSPDPCPGSGSQDPGNTADHWRHTTLIWSEHQDASEE